MHSFMKMNKTRSVTNAANTLPEVLIAVVLVATFFASILELNAVCLRCIDASKELLAAVQSVQDRSEVLRNIAFSDLTNTSFVQNVMNTSANPAPFSKKATEVVTISKYPTANGVTKFIRAPNGTVTTDSIATDLGKGLLKVYVQVYWTIAVAGRTRIVPNSS